MAATSSKKLVTVPGMMFDHVDKKVVKAARYAFHELNRALQSGGGPITPFIDRSEIEPRQLAYNYFRQKHLDWLQSMLADHNIVTVSAFNDESMQIMYYLDEQSIVFGQLYNQNNPGFTDGVDPEIGSSREQNKSAAIVNQQIVLLQQWALEWRATNSSAQGVHNLPVHQDLVTLHQVLAAVHQDLAATSAPFQKSPSFEINTPLQTLNKTYMQVHPVDLSVIDPSLLNKGIANHQSTEDQFAEDHFAEDQVAAAQVAATQVAEAQVAEGQFEEGQFAETQFAETQFAEGQFEEDQFAKAQFARYQFAEDQFDKARSLCAHISSPEVLVTPAKPQTAGDLMERSFSGRKTRSHPTRSGNVTDVSSPMVHTNGGSVLWTGAPVTPLTRRRRGRNQRSVKYGDVFTEKPSSDLEHLIDDDTPFEEIFEHFPNHITLRTVAKRLRGRRGKWTSGRIAQRLIHHESMYKNDPKGAEAWVKEQRNRYTQYLLRQERLAQQASGESVYLKFTKKRGVKDDDFSDNETPTKQAGGSQKKKRKAADEEVYFSDEATPTKKAVRSGKKRKVVNEDFSDEETAVGKAAPSVKKKHLKKTFDEEYVDDDFRVVSRSTRRSRPRRTIGFPVPLPEREEEEEYTMKDFE